MIKKKHKAMYGKDIEILKNMHNQRKKDFEFKSIERNMHLNKENQKLLNRLLQVHKPTQKRHTRSTVRGATRRKNKGNKEFASVPSEQHLALKQKPFRPKSLNINVRINNDMKIREENIRMAKRLVDRKPVLDFKSLKNEYLVHKKAVKYMQKIRSKKPKFKGRANHLPPLAPHSKNMSVDEINKEVEKLIKSEETTVEHTTDPKA